MIKFFRRIRQQLMNDNKFGKYLLYASGEIFLVVIGILIALYINTWNQDRIKKQEELMAMQTLLEEVEANYQKFDNSRQFHLSRDSAIRALLFTDVSVMSLNTIDNLYWKTLYSSQMNPSFSVFNTLVSTGQLNRFSNQDLNTELSLYKDLIIDYMDGEDDVWEHSQAQLFDFDMDSEALLTEVKFNLRDRTNEEIANDKKHYIALFSNPIYRNHLSMTILYLAVIHDDGETVEKEFKTMKRLLTKNIDLLQN